MFKYSAFLAGMLLCTAATQAQEEGPTWLTDFAKAKVASTDSGKAILVNFIPADTNATLEKLKSEVLEKPEFGTWASENVVLLNIELGVEDEDQKAANTKLAKELGVRNFPQLVFLDEEGKKIGQLGYKPGGTKNWVGAADKVLASRKGASKAAAHEWMTNYEEALARAKKEGKPILADFTGSDWCGWCIKLKGEVFDKPEFQKWAAENVVLLELDFPRKKELPKELVEQNAKLRDKHGIRGYPTILFLDAKGEKVGQSGYVEGGPEAWIKKAEEQMGERKKR